MSYIRRISLAGLLLCAATSLASADTDLKELVEETRTSVVLIKTFDKHGKLLCFGTGFFVDNTGHIITNYHVLKGAFTAKAYSFKGIERQITHIVDQNKSVDLIRLQTDGDPPSSFLAISNQMPRVGEKVFIIGHPQNFEFTVSDGIISSIRRLPGFGCDMLQLTAPASPGSSGAPVLNMRGQVIGVATTQFKEGQNLNFAVISSQISNLAKNDVYMKSIQAWSNQENNSDVAFGDGKPPRDQHVVDKEINEAKNRLEKKRQAMDQRIAAERRPLDMKRSDLDLEHQSLLTEKNELDISKNYLLPGQYNQLVHNFNVKLNNYEHKHRQLQNQIESFNRWAQKLADEFNSEINALNIKVYGAIRERQIAETERAQQMNEADIAKWTQGENVEIFLKDGKVIKTSAFWEESGHIVYQKYGGTIKIDKSKVKEVKE